MTDNIKNEIPDLYKILGLTSNVCNETNCNELIQKAYNKKAKIYHPDKHPGKKDIEDIFELLTNAYQILKDDKQRSSYNHKMKLYKQSNNDFNKLKQQTQEYISEIKPINDKQIISFKEGMENLDKKRGFNSTLMVPITIQESKNRLKDLNIIRSTQDVEYKPENIFDGEINLKKFNAVFDKVNKEDNQIIINNIPKAWNDGKIINYSSYETIDNLYIEDNDINKYFKENKITKNDMVNIEEAEYVNNHNKLSNDYYKEVKDKIENREKFENIEYEKDTLGYGIFDKLNIDDNLINDY